MEGRQEPDVTIAALARQVSVLSLQLCSYLSSNSFPEPSFAADDGDVPETLEYEALRVPLNDVLLDLLRLVNGPMNTLQELFFSHYDLGALQIALSRNMFKHVPLPSVPGEIKCASVAEIAQKAGMDEDRTARVLRVLETRRIFAEDKDGLGYFTHTANSAFLARNRDIYALADMQMEEMLKIASESSSCIDKSPYHPDPPNSPFNRKFGTYLYQYYEARPEKAERFARAMSGWSQLSRKEGNELETAFPWASLRGGNIVDIGGGNGHVSIELARKYPALQFIVQDVSPVMLSQAREADVDNRLILQQHNFFDPQPVHNASVFILRQCLHNYHDEEATKILRAVVPAMERSGPRTTLLINEMILPEKNTVARSLENQLRRTDCCMMVLMCAKERSMEEFHQLVKDADKRLEIVRVSRGKLSLGLLEVRLNFER